MAYKFKELDGLSDQEKEIALKILEQYSESGKSDLLENILEYDFKEQPVDIITFIKDYRYLGKAWHLPNGKLKLFPYWEETLKKIFPDNKTTNYNTLIESGARGLGKSEIAITCGLYLMHRLMCLRNPYEYLNLKPSEQVAFAFMNIKIELAENIGMSKFQNTVQMSPWFMERGTISGTKNKKWNPPPFINIIVGSQADSVIGQPIYFFFMDEISFIRNLDVEVQKKKALDIIDTALGGMRTRFLDKGQNPTLLVVASSKRSEKSFIEEYMRKKAHTDPERTYIVDEPVWKVRPPEEYSGKKFNVALGNRFLASEVLPESVSDLDPYILKGYKILEVPIEYKTAFIENIDRALCDYAGISSSELSTYISGDRVSVIVTDTYKNPFTKDIIEVGNAKNDYTQYSDFFILDNVDKNLKSRPLFIHFDTSLSGDKTGIAGTWIVGKRTPKENEIASNELYYKLAFSVAIKAPKGHQISFAKNRQFVYFLKENGFNIKGISSDTFQSANFKQDLERDFKYTTISVDKVSPNGVCEPYHYLKSTIYEERLSMYKSNLLIEELIGLERNSTNGKIDHSPQSINSKDVADALCGSIWNASKHAEEFAFNFGEYINDVVEVNTSTDLNRKQVQVEFEKELTNLLDPMAKYKEQQTIESKEKPTDKNQEVNFLDFGFGKAQEIKPNYFNDGIIWW